MRGAAIFVVIVLSLPFAFVQAQAQTTDADRCPDLQHLVGIGDVCLLENGLYELFAPDGRSLGFTHGPDPRCDACDGPMVLAAGGSTTPVCVTGAAGQYFIHVIYARATDDADRYATMAPAIRDLVAQANAMVDEAAIATGDRLSLRVKCASGVVVVENEVLPTARSATSMSTILNDLNNKGYTDNRQKYWVYYDDAGACGCAGAGHIYGDDSNSVNNLNNAPSNAAAMFAVSFDSNAVRTMLHELGHNLGAVQNSAPRSSGAGHCTDGRDTMCYNDGGSQSGACQPDFTCSGVCSVEVFDCNKDTYCHATPATGSYLATHWQACHRQSRFLQYADNVAPVMAALSCSPEPSYPAETVTCSFSATDTSAGLYYTVAWGDGATSRAPASGTVTPGTTQIATHAYASQSAPTISVTATDDGFPAMTSAARTVSHSVGPANVAPTIVTLSCSPSSPNEGDLVTCTFSGSDTDNVSYAVGWDDGSASTRVPATGVVVASATQTATHTYTRGGSFAVSVRATDDGRPPTMGPASAVNVVVTEVNTVPVITAFSCPSGIVPTGTTVTCTFTATDDSAGIRHDINWGDGATSVIPASGYVAPGSSRSATHTYTAGGDRNVTLTVTDDAASPLSAVSTRLIKVRDDTTGPAIVLNDPRTGNVYFGCTASAPWGISRAVMVQTGCVRASVSDPSGVARVQVVRPSDGVVLATDTSAPYELAFDIPSGELGVTYQVRAVDNIGNVKTAIFTFDAV